MPLQMATEGLSTGDDVPKQPLELSPLLKDLRDVQAGQASEVTRLRIAAELADVKSPLSDLLGLFEQVDSALWNDRVSPNE